MVGLNCETVGEKDSLREVANATNLRIFLTILVESSIYSAAIFVDRERWSGAWAYFMKAKVRTMCRRGGCFQDN